MSRRTWVGRYCSPPYPPIFIRTHGHGSRSAADAKVVDDERTNRGCQRRCHGRSGLRASNGNGNSNATIPDGAAVRKSERWRTDVKTSVLEEISTM
ncbi:hypothetical protein C8R44DRAFT_774173 [Mycena epipterygia]|nr:hypothetical protein C8R44DRAFT_774173 [Mycena epipterygia]